MLLKKALSVYSVGLRRAFGTTPSSIETYKITASSTPDGETSYISGKTNNEYKIGKPLEFILATLAGCENTTASSYAKTLGIEIRSVSFQAEADYESSRFYSLEGKPNIFSQIRMNVEVDTDGTQEDVEKLRAVVAKHNPIQNMLSSSGVDIQSTWTKKKKH